MGTFVTIVLSILLFLKCMSITKGHVPHTRADERSHITHNIPMDIEKHEHGFTPAPHTNKLHKDICHDDAVCVPFVRCPAHVRIESKTSCKIIGGRTGVCCTTGQNHTERMKEHGKGRHHHLIHIDPASISSISRHSREGLSELRSRESRLLSAGFSTILVPGSAAYSHFRNSRTFNLADLSEVMGVANKALEIAIATKAFKDRQGLSNQDLELQMVQQDLRPTALGHTCAPKPHCPRVPAKYRRIDGTCNNIYNPTWGTPMTPYSRLLPPSYQDGIWSTRLSVHGTPLTSPRLISTEIFPDEDIPNYDYTLLLMQFGQFISHDITQSLDMSFENGSAISCCARDGSEELPKNLRHFACLPIELPKTDKFYGTFKQRCMNFVRSVLAPRQDCTLGYAQQMNKITHYIDSSSVYGSTSQQTGDLRSFEGGKLKVFNDFGRDLLPLSEDPDACLTMEQGSACFRSGDTRTNQMISLVVLHTLFTREHNRLAEELQKLNPHWNDEQLFLEARQILMGEMQVIIYKEFLPAVVGDLAMEEFELNLAKGLQYSYDYDQRVEASVTNEFGTAALRFGHSMVDGLLKIYGSKKIEEMIFIPEVMFYPARMRKHFFMDELLSTLTTEPIQEVDNCMSEALTRYMFRAGNPFGVDLAAINIQRGRDHGLRPYNDYRELTGLPRIKSFDEYGPDLGPKLKSVYASVDDIDLWVGGLLEEKAPGSIVGPTFRDIIADQFARLKKGDKYFFENDPSINPGHFTPEQLQEVRKASMSRIICDNSDGFLLAKQAKNAFRRPGVPGNEFLDCEGFEIPRLDLVHWQE